MVEKEIENIKENYEQNNYEIKSMRNRLHTAENNIASNFAILAETKANAEWLMNSLEKTTSRVTACMDTIESKFNNLVFRLETLEKRVTESQIKTMEEKISALANFKNMVFSKNTVIAILSLIYIGDKFDMISNFEHMRKILGW